MAQLPCVSAARPLLAVPPARGRWRGPRARRRAVAAGARAGAGPVATVAEAGVDEEEEEVERYALGGACKVLAGMPAPLGATALAGGVNFAVYSDGASAAVLCLFTPDDLNAVGELNRVLREFGCFRFVSYRTVPCSAMLNRTLREWRRIKSRRRFRSIPNSTGRGTCGMCLSRGSNCTPCFTGTGLTACLRLSLATIMMCLISWWIPMLR
jgi:hypothetical protein